MYFTDAHDVCLKAFKQAWLEDKKKAIVVDLAKLRDAPRTTDTTLARPWKEIQVSPAEIKALRDSQYHCLEFRELYAIGKLRDVVNSNPYDVDNLALADQLLSRKPGEGPFTGVVTGPYGNRDFKYLYVIDHAGMHIIREMTPCEASSRGIALHSLIKNKGVIGGEIFFDHDDPGTVVINFGSARLPIQNSVQAEQTARFVLSLGYTRVVAVFPDRELSSEAYGMKDRYGSQVQNVVFTASQSEVKEDL